MTSDNSRQSDVTADDREPLAPSAEVAAYLNRTVDALAQMRFRGEGPPYIKAGRKILYRWPDVRAWVKAHRVQTR